MATFSLCRRRRSPPRSRGPTVTPRLERLEDRCVPSVAGADPLPISGGFFNPTGGAFVHSNLPGPADAPPPNPPTGPLAPANEPATISDFNGAFAGADVQGTGTDGHGNTLYFKVDLRFMQGLYRDVNGDQQQGTFAFV
jgi:hypothetical protein